MAVFCKCGHNKTEHINEQIGENDFCGPFYDRIGKCLLCDCRALDVALPISVKDELAELLLAFQKWQVTSGKLKQAYAYREFREMADKLAKKYDINLPDFKDEIQG